MTGDYSSPEVVPSTQNGTINIVPLYVPEAPAATTTPHLTYNNGPLLTAVQVFTIFWGSAWQEPSLNNLVQNINKFFGFILTSSLMDQLTEYNTQEQHIGHGSLIGTTMVTTADPGSSIADSDIQQMLNDGITNGTFPQPTANTLYFVYLPSGTTVTQGGVRSCQTFCGYHDTINGQIFYAVMPYPDCAGCMGNLSVFDALTTTSSHELCEAVTDPVPGQGWYDQDHGEIGDICAWHLKQIGNYTVQMEWSNNAKNCV